MADLKTTAEERAFAVQCRSCFGRGMRDPTCFRCDDSTEDHECPPEVTCGACKGSGDNPEVRLILDDLDTLLAEVERLRGALRSVRDDYDCDGVGTGGLECRHCLARAALGEP